MTILVPAGASGAGEPFEIHEEEVLGERMPVFRHRRRRLGELIEASAGFGDREYLVFPDRRLTYIDHYLAVASVARGLRERYGIRPGSRVAILASNSAEWVMVFWAVVSLGGVVVALNAWWAGEEIDYALGDAEPHLFVADRRRLDRLASPPSCPVVEIEAGAAELAELDPGRRVPRADVGEDDPAVILYTSGTTGRPKGAVHSHRNMLAQLQVQSLIAGGGAHAGPGRGTPRILVGSPFFHVSGLHNGAVARLASGATMVAYTGRFDPVSVMRTIERERCTSWSAVPTAVWRVVHHPDVGRYDLSSVARISGGGSSWSPALQERMREVFGEHVVFGVGYGSTECTAWATTATTADDLRAHPTTVGRPVPTVQVEVRGPDGNPVPEGTEGEVCVRSPLVMLGYWRNDDATAAVIGSGRWLHTGDLGYVSDGLLFLSARRGDLIIRGGENVYPVEIENCLEAHPDVAECAVVGVPHEELGQEVAAAVVLHDGARAGADDLAEYLGTRLAYFKVPSRWLLPTQPLPRTATGKVVRDEVFRAIHPVDQTSHGE